MGDSKSENERGPASLDSHIALPRRQFLGDVAKVGGGLLLADLAGNIAYAQTQSAAAPAVQSKKFTDWGWPEPYEQISAKSKQWLQSKGWWPLNAAWIVVWSGEEMVGHVLQTQKLLEKRGIEIGERLHVHEAHFAMIPGAIRTPRRRKRGTPSCRSSTPI